CSRRFSPMVRSRSRIASRPSTRATISRWPMHSHSKPQRSACSPRPTTNAKALAPFSRSARQDSPAPEHPVNALATAAARLTALSVRDFRNLAHVGLEPPRDGFVAVGENGQGKTNLLESIHYLQILRSARGARDQDLVRFGEAAFHIAAVVETERAHEIGVGFERAGKRKRVRIDGDIPTRLSDALGALPSVMFSPEDVDLIAGSP